MFPLDYVVLWTYLIPGSYQWKLVQIVHSNDWCQSAFRRLWSPKSLDSSKYRTLSPWASYQICKSAGCACAGNAGNVFPRHRFQRKPLVSDPGMHHGTCVTYVPWCMLGSLAWGDGENVPGIPGASALAILRIWQEAHGWCSGHTVLYALFNKAFTDVFSNLCQYFIALHNNVIKWKHSSRNWPFVRGHKSQWHGPLMFSLICAWTNGWVNNRYAGDLRRHRAHYDVTVMTPSFKRYRVPS